MLQDSAANNIETSLQQLVDALEERSPALSVVWAKRYLLPFREYGIKVTVAKTRPFNVLEEYLLKTADELSPAPTVDELADALGLYPVFVVTVADKLEKLGVLTVDRTSGLLTLTEKGAQLYREGKLPEKSEIRTCYAYAEPVGKTLDLRVDPLEPAHGEDLSIASLQDFALDYPDPQGVDLTTWINRLNQAGLRFHAPLQGTLVTEVGVPATCRLLNTPFTLMLVYDGIERTLGMKAYEGDDFIENDTLSHGLNEYFQANPERFPIDRSALQLTISEKDEQRLRKHEQMVMEYLTASAGASTWQADAVRLIRTREQRSELLKIIAGAQQQLLIFSPWINRTVVDDEFIALLKERIARGVWVVIGYGIAKTIEDQENIDQAVIERLNTLQLKNGLRPLQVQWVGNAHIKEAIADRTVCLTGSLNWLSYRGGFLPRRERVICFRDCPIVQDMYDEWEDEFMRVAEERLAVYHRQRSAIAAGIDYVSLSCALGRELQVLKVIRQGNGELLIPLMNAVTYSLKSPQKKYSEELINELLLTICDTPLTVAHESVFNNMSSALHGSMKALFKREQLKHLAAQIRQNIKTANGAINP